MLFVAVMHCKRQRESLPNEALALCKALLLFGFLWDFLVNVVMMVVFLDPPRQRTVSERLTLYKSLGQGRWINRYRRAVAAWVCSRLLDWADPSGGHCG